jgi:hypothetical protein
MNPEFAEGCGICLGCIWCLVKPKNDALLCLNIVHLAGHLYGGWFGPGHRSLGNLHFFRCFPMEQCPSTFPWDCFPHSSPNIISSSFASKDVAMTIKTHIFPDGNRTNFWGNRKYPRRKSHHTVNYMAVSWWVYPQFLDTTMTCCWLYITFHFNYIPWYHPIEYHFFSILHIQLYSTCP